MTAVPAGNLEPSTLAQFIVKDFRAAWDAMCMHGGELEAGGNFMFARQAFTYLELAARTASTNDACLIRFAQFLAARDRRYFTTLPAPVPTPSSEFRLPAIPGVPPQRQLLTAIFDMSRHGLAHLYQQTPVDLADSKQWITTFMGASHGRVMADANTTARRDRHLSYSLGASSGRVHIYVRPDVLLADLVWAAALAPVFSQDLVPHYLYRPRRKSPRPVGPKPAKPYAFTSSALVEALTQGGHPEVPWPGSSEQ